MDFGVPPSLVAPGELPPAEVAGEGLLPGVCAYVRREVVAPAEAAHADAALERLVAGVDAHVARQLVRAREPPVASLRGTGVRPLVDRRLARSVRVLPWPQYWPEWDALRMGAVYRRPRPVYRTRQSKVSNGVQGSQRRRDSEGVKRAREWLDVLKHSHVVPLTAAGLIKTPIVGNDGEERPVYSRLWGWVGRGGVC